MFFFMYIRYVININTIDGLSIRIRGHIRVIFYIRIRNAQCGCQCGYFT